LGVKEQGDKETGNRKQEAGNRKQETGSRKQETGSRKGKSLKFNCVNGER